MKKLEMWSEFIFLVFIIYKAEAQLPEDEMSVIRLNYSSQNNESYTVWKNKPLKIVIENANARFLWCNSFFPNNETGRYSQFVPQTLFTPDIYSILNITKVTAEMNTMWKCTVLTNYWEWSKPYNYKGQNYGVKDFCFQVHVKGLKAPQTILVNNMVVPAVIIYNTMGVDFTAEYQYVNGDIVNVTCVNLLNKDKGTLTMEYEMAGTTSDKSTVKDISSSKIIGFVTKLHAGHNNSYMICTNTGPKDYTKVMIRFVMLTKPNVISISINGMILRPRLDSFTNRHYEIKYKLVSHQPMNVTCEVERTDVKLLMLDDDFGKTVRTKTEYIIPNKKTELSFYINQGDDKSLACSADYVMGGLAESVYIEFTTAIFPIDIYSQVHMELPPSGTVMELYSYKDYKLSVILYELKQNETLHLTCGPLPYYYGPLLYLQLNDTEIRLEVNSNVSVHVSWEHVYPEIVCFLKNATKTVLKDIRVIFLERALAVTEPSSTTLSTTTLTADIVTNNTTAEPPTSETSKDSNNNNSLAYFLTALGIAIVIIILVKKQCYVRLCLPIPALRLDPASVFYVNLLSVCRPINEREAAALPENIYEEIPLGDLSNINSNRNKSDNQNDHLPNDDTHHYMEIDYAQCKPKGTEAPHKNNYIYDEPYPH